MKDANNQLWLALGAIIVLAFVVDTYPTLGGGLLILVVLSMLLTAQRKGMLN